MIPMWKFAPAIACGNAFILKPSERDPERAVETRRTDDGSGLARRHPQRRQRRQGGSRRDSWTTPTSSRDRLRRLDAYRRVHLHARALWKRGSACSAFGGAKNHMVVMPDADHEPSRRCADRRRLRLRRESAAWQSRSPFRSARKRPMRLMAKLIPRVESSQDRAVHRFVRRGLTARSSPQQALDRDEETTSRSASRRVRPSPSMAAASRCKATRTASTSAAACSTT